jgi:hypothetical protein
MKVINIENTESVVLSRVTYDKMVSELRELQAYKEATESDPKIVVIEANTGWWMGKDTLGYRWNFMNADEAIKKLQYEMTRNEAEIIRLKTQLDEPKIKTKPWCAFWK